MKIKYFLIYVFVGAAFLGVSLWAFLSGGRSARALRAKYRLGGILLTTWAMLSISSCCGHIIPEVTCYDPVVPENIVNVHAEKLIRGEKHSLSISYPEFSSFRWYIYDKNRENVLQQGVFSVPEEHDSTVDFEFVPDAGLPSGEILLVIEGFFANEDGTESSFDVFVKRFELQ